MDKIAEAALRVKTASLSIDELQILGQRASKMYLNGGTPLNEAIVKVAQEQANLTVEHVKRITEFANNATYLDLFEKQAGDKVIDFNIADPRQVLRSLDVHARPAEANITPDYGIDPVKLSSANKELEADLTLAEIFGVSLLSPSMQKAASGDIIPDGKADDKSNKDFSKRQLEIGAKVEREHTSNPALAEEITRDHLAEDPEYYTKEKPKDWGAKEIKKEAMTQVKIAGADSDLVLQDLKKITSLENITKVASSSGYKESNPFGELYRAREDLLKLAEDAQDAVCRNQEMNKEASRSLQYEMKQHLLSGGNIGEVAHAMNSLHGYNWTKTAMQQVLPELLPHLNPTKMRTDAIFYEIEKSASQRVVDMSNPLIEAFDSFVKTAKGHTVLDASLKKISSLLCEVESLATEAARRENASSMQ